MRTFFGRTVENVRKMFSRIAVAREERIYAFLKSRPLKAILPHISANTLGYMRIGTTFLVVGFFMNQHYIAAIACFLFGVLTDLIDGPLARMTNTVSEDGKILDAVADKVFILAPLLFVGSAHLKTITLWMVIFMETLLIFVANLLKPYLRTRHNILLVTGSNGLGQTKMVVQCFGLGVLLLGPERVLVLAIGEILIWIAIVLSIGSMLRHLARFEVPVIPEKRIVTIPNLVTLSGILVIPFFIRALVNGYAILSIVLLLWMYVSDLLDGLLARILNARTAFGAVLDPIRDNCTRLMLLIWFFSKTDSLFLYTILVGIGCMELVIATANIYYAKKFRTVRLVTRWGKRRAFVHALCGSVLFCRLTEFLSFAHYDQLIVLTLFSFMFISSVVALVSYAYQGGQLTAQ